MDRIKFHEDNWVSKLLNEKDLWLEYELVSGLWYCYEYGEIDDLLGEGHSPQEAIREALNLNNSHTTEG